MIRMAEVEMNCERWDEVYFVPSASARVEMLQAVRPDQDAVLQGAEAISIQVGKSM